MQTPKIGYDSEEDHFLVLADFLKPSLQQTLRVCTVSAEPAYFGADESILVGHNLTTSDRAKIDRTSPVSIRLVVNNGKCIQNHLEKL